MRGRRGGVKCWAELLHVVMQDVHCLHSWNSMPWGCAMWHLPKRTSLSPFNNSFIQTFTLSFQALCSWLSLIISFVNYSSVNLFSKQFLDRHDTCHNFVFHLTANCSCVITPHTHHHCLIWVYLFITLSCFSKHPAQSRAQRLFTIDAYKAECQTSFLEARQKHIWRVNSQKAKLLSVSFMNPQSLD